MKKNVIEYFENYFGQLNESITHEDLIEAVLDLIELRNMVLNEANVARASMAHGARETITNAIADKSMRSDIMNTGDGRRLIKRHTTPVKKAEGPQIPWYSPNFLKQKPSVTNPRSGTFTRSQRTRQLAKKAIDAGPEGNRQFTFKPTGKGEGKHQEMTRQEVPKASLSDSDHEAQALAGYIKGASDMESRLARLAQQGRARRETKRDMDIHDSYNPKLIENDSREKYKKLIDRIHDTTVVPGVGKAVDKMNDYAKKTTIANTISPNPDNPDDMNDYAKKTTIANTISSNPDNISLTDLKHAERLWRERTMEAKAKRASRGELRKRGIYGRNRREHGGQGNLFQ